MFEPLPGGTITRAWLCTSLNHRPNRLNLGDVNLVRRIYSGSCRWQPNTALCLSLHVAIIGDAGFER